MARTYKFNKIQWLNSGTLWTLHCQLLALWCKLSIHIKVFTIPLDLFWLTNEQMSFVTHAHASRGIINYMVSPVGLTLTFKWCSFPVDIAAVTGMNKMQSSRTKIERIVTGRCLPVKHTIFPLWNQCWK